MRIQNLSDNQIFHPSFIAIATTSVFTTQISELILVPDLCRLTAALPEDSWPFVLR